MYFLGIDIGATKSHALITDEAGRVLGFGLAGPGKRIGDDYSRQRRTLDQIVTAACRMAGIAPDQIAGAGFGISDYDWDSQRPDHVATIEPLGLRCPVGLVNDAVIGMLAGASEGWGIGLIAGTGCNCWGWDRDHRAAHVTGFGLWMGEGAGAHELMYLAVRAVGMAWSGLGPATALTAAFADRIGARDADDLIEGLTLRRYHLDAETAPLVFQVAEAGDPVARDVIARAGRMLAEQAIAVCRRLDLQNDTFEVVLAGSLYKGGPLLIDPLRDHLLAAAPRAQLVRLEARPVIGGVVLGMQQAGLPVNVIARARASLAAVDLDALG
ncbi:MAG: ATPase [Anaerolineae bacterium]|nr:ATPase [Anaerolineae bacterium]